MEKLKKKSRTKPKLISKTERYKKEFPSKKLKNPDIRNKYLN